MCIYIYIHIVITIINSSSSSSSVVNIVMIVIIIIISIVIITIVSIVINIKHVCVYIYIYRERERDIAHTHTHTHGDKPPYAYVASLWGALQPPSGCSSCWSATGAPSDRSHNSIYRPTSLTRILPKRKLSRARSLRVAPLSLGTSPLRNKGLARGWAKQGKSLYYRDWPYMFVARAVVWFCRSL